MSLKQIHEIKLKDILLLDETKNAKHLFNYRLLPIYFYKNKLEKLTKEIYERIGDSDVSDISDKFDHIMDLRKLQILEALYNACYAELHLNTKVNVYKLLIEKKPIESKNLEEILQKIKQYTGIDILKPDDFLRFKKKVEFIKDKFEEKYHKKQSEQKEEVKITKIIYSIFHYLNEPYNENMRLLTFVELKNMAEDEIKKAQLKKHKNG